MILYSMTGHTHLNRFIAHRGVPSTHLENTLSSFLHAHALGMTEVEFDVRLSSCNTPVVIHDSTLLRTHGVGGVVSRMSAQQLVDLGVPTLKEVVALLDTTNMHATVEIKSCSERALPDIVEMCLRGGHTLSSFEHDWLTQASLLSSDISLQCTLEKLDSDASPFPAFVLDGRCAEIASDIRNTTPTGIARARALNCDVLAYTVKTKQQLKRAVDLGVDGIFVNDPISVRRWFEDSQQRVL